MNNKKIILCRVIVAIAALTALPAPAAAKERHFLYVAAPGLRNELDHGGIGILVFDIDNQFRFVRRISTWKQVPGQEVENVKGVVADAKSHRLYLTTLTKLAAFDLLNDKMIWEKTLDGGCDRLAISPDGSTLYVPALEGLWWNVVKASNGEITATIKAGAGSHNTFWSEDGSRVYLSGLHYNYLLVADPKTNAIVKRIGPFDNSIRPFTVNGSNTLCFVDVDGLLGFQIGDLRTGGLLYTVNVAGFPSGHANHHSTPSHGIALTGDEKEIWLADGVNHYLHVFDSTAMPPKQIASVKNSVMPGWISFSIDGKYVIPSTGEIIDRRSRKIVFELRDETGQRVQSEKLLEIDFNNGRSIRSGSSFGVGEVH